MTGPARALSAGADLALVPMVTAAQRGDRDAFGRLVDATRSVVTSISLAILRDEEASRDVAQDVYLEAWRGLPRLRNPSSFLPWLRQLTRNRAHHALRTEVRRRRRDPDGRADELLAAAADPAPDAEQRLVAAEERAALGAALAELPDVTREVVVLYYREERSARQVADLLGLSEAAVRQRLSRARAQVRERLLEDAGHALRASAPGAAFTTAVMTALALAAPGTAAAATLAAGAATKGASGAGASQLAAKTGLAATGGAIGGVVAGLAGGLWGIFAGARHLHRQARDDEERRGIVVYAVTGSLAIFGFLAVVLLWPTRYVVTGAFVGFMATLLGLCFGWIPHVTRRRMAAELREDPEGARLRQERERRRAIIGATVGVVLGSLPIVFAWIYKW